MPNALSNASTPPMHASIRKMAAFVASANLDSESPMHAVQAFATDPNAAISATAPLLPRIKDVPFT